MLVGGLKCSSSFVAQTTLVLANPTESMPETRYVKGETRYMNIQKRGRLCGDARTLFCS